MNNQIQFYHPSENNQISENIYRTSIDGLFYINVPKHNDDRGFFSEVVKFPELNSAIGYDFNVKQINLARSVKNAAKGMHAEDWNKLVTLTSGKAFSALVDIRPNSPTFKKIEYFMLGFDHENESGNALFINKGIANSLLALSDEANYLYFVDKLYSERNKKDNLSISMFDPDLNIQWPIPKEKMIISGRDKTAIALKELMEK